MFAPAHLCTKCKGSKMLCGQTFCPILEKMNLQKTLFMDIKKDIFGPSPPNIFVGHTSYPYVSVGAIASEENVIDNPREMFGQSINEIIEGRSKLFRSAVKKDVLSRDKYITDMREIVLSEKSVDVELNFKFAPKPTIDFSPLEQPMGPLGMLEKYKIAGNPKIPKKVDSVVNENITATLAMEELVKKGYDNYYLTKVFSSGAFGREQFKKLVPTRWSITASDDIISKIYMNQIRNSPELSDYELYHCEYLENSFVIMMMPGPWEFENFEAWARGSLWNLSGDLSYITVEHEFNEGRKKYADLQVGGYYASRFAVTENLFGRNKQARVIVIREIDTGYVVPVGVWQVRENVRNAFLKGPIKFSTLEDMFSYARILLKNPLDEYLKKDIILKQRKIRDWF
jgi:DNA repair protein NreA